MILVEDRKYRNPVVLVGLFVKLLKPNSRAYVGEGVTKQIEYVKNK